MAVKGLIPSVQLAGDYVEPTKVIEPEATQDFETFDSEDTSASAISSRFEKASEKRKEAMSDKVPPRPEGLTMSSIFGGKPLGAEDIEAVSYTHLRAHETPEHLVCRLLLEKKKKEKKNSTEQISTTNHTYNTRAIRHNTRHPSNLVYKC